MEVCYSRLDGVNIIFEAGSQVTKGEKSKILETGCGGLEIATFNEKTNQEALQAYLGKHDLCSWQKPVAWITIRRRS